MTRRRILNEYQLERIKEHKYLAEGISLFEAFLQPFWIWLVEKVPETWSANSITLFGLLGNVLSTATLMVFCPKGYGTVPWWCYLVCGIFLMLYQTLDNIDGRHARRTKSSTPLGEFFDHGCDSVSMVMIITGACISTQIGVHPSLFSLVNFTTMILFFAAQWKTAVIGVMKFSFIDVTEGQTLVIIFYLLNSKFGSSYWNYEPISGWKLNVIMWLAFLGLGCLIFCNYLRVILGGNREIPMEAINVPIGDCLSVPYNGLSKRPALPSRFRPFVPLSTFAVLGFSCYVFSKYRVVEDNLVLYHLMFGIVISKLTCLILVSYMTKSKMPCFDSIFLGPCFFLLVQLLRFKEQLLFLWIALGFNVINILVYAYRVCNDMCDHLEIYCFRMTNLEKHS